MTLALYRGLTTAAEPVIRCYVDHRLRHGKEDPGRVAERFGEPSVARPPGPLAWIHAASVGESLSMLSLIDRLQRDRPGLNLLMTTGTVTSARLLARRLPPGVVHQYAPIDRLAWVRAFLDHWRPSLALWVESELWPNMLGEIAERRISAVLINARISPRSFRGWQRLPGVARRLLGTFALALAQTEEDAAKLRRLGAPVVRCPGNLKFAADPLPADQAALAALERGLAGRPVWLAASTHPGEEAILAEAHRAVRAAGGALAAALLIIVPRHPDRGPEIAAALAADGHAVGLRSAGAPPADSIYVADGMGELGLFYRLAGVAFIGGSLVPHGGQNLLEPAKLDCAVLHGPYMTNFTAMAREMAEAGATAEAATAADIAAAVVSLLTDEALRARRIAAGRRVAAGKTEILDAVIAELAPFLDAALAGGRDAAHA